MNSSSRGDAWIQMKATLLLDASLLLLVALALAACSSTPPEKGNDPPGFSCEYNPFGASAVDFIPPSPEALGEFDLFARVRITGHADGASDAGLVNLATVEEALQGPVSAGDDIELHSVFRLCLETNDDYYVLAEEQANGDYFHVMHPWATFPVINNRITHHPIMRNDNLVGDFHGLDPVLFKRRFVELVGRDDIEVD